MDEAIELRYAGWVLTVSCIDDEGFPKPTYHLSVTCRPYRHKGVTFQIAVRATSQLLSLIDVPDDPDDDILMQANARLLWLVNPQNRTATLTFIENTAVMTPTEPTAKMA